MKMWRKNVRELCMAENNEMRQLCIHNYSIQETDKRKLLFIGDPMQTMGLAHVLWHEGFHHVQLATLCTDVASRKLYRKAPGLTSPVFMQKRPPSRKKGRRSAWVLSIAPFLKSRPMVRKEIIIGADIGQLRPFLHIDRVSVKIVDFRAANGEHEGRMRRDHELTAHEARAVLNELRQLLLPLR